jgi:hypothetical protein
MCHYVRKPSRPIIYIIKRARHTTLVQKHSPKIALLLTKVRLQELQLALLGVLQELQLALLLCKFTDSSFLRVVGAAESPSASDM